MTVRLMRPLMAISGSMGRADARRRTARYPKILVVINPGLKAGVLQRRTTWNT